jgi:hypothetical protein
VEAGLLSYLALIAGARWAWPPDGQLPPTANDLLGLAASPVAIWLLATCAYPFWSTDRCTPTTAPRRRTAGVVLALGLLFIAIEVSFFSHDYEAAAANPPGGTARAERGAAPDRGGRQAFRDS